MTLQQVSNNNDDNNNNDSNLTNVNRLKKVTAKTNVSVIYHMNC